MSKSFVSHVSCLQRERWASCMWSGLALNILGATPKDLICMNLELWFWLLCNSSIEPLSLPCLKSDACGSNQRTDIQLCWIWAKPVTGLSHKSVWGWGAQKPSRPSYDWGPQSAILVSVEGTITCKCESLFVCLRTYNLWLKSNQSAARQMRQWSLGYKPVLQKKRALQRTKKSHINPLHD